MAKEYLVKIELAYNQIDHIPILSACSGMLRLLVGTVEAAASLPLYLLYLISLKYSIVDYRVSLKRHSHELLLHGAINIGRGSLATIPFFGNISCMLWDFKSYRIRYAREIPIRAF